MTHRLKTAFLTALIASASTGAFASEPGLTLDFINRRIELAREAGFIMRPVGNGVYSVELAEKPFITELVGKYPKTADAILIVVSAAVFAISYWYIKTQNTSESASKKPAEQTASCCSANIKNQN